MTFKISPYGVEGNFLLTHFKSQHSTTIFMNDDEIDELVERINEVIETGE